MEPGMLQQFTELLRYDQEQTGYTEAKLTQHDQEVSDGQLH
jgi:hypothetical protein